ncbi:MAG: tyrosine-type recombinase/integrase [Pyrinomonadaceae bacterium]
MLPDPPSRERFLSDEEKRKLLAAVSHDKRLTSIILIGLLTGWRKGQILGVRKIDLDYINKAVTIKKSKQSPPRKVPVSLMAWSIFVNLAENAEDYLFGNRDGNRLGDFKDSWWKALSEAENFHFHDLRHTFATDMITGGARDFTVQVALGHANIKTTGIYAHIQNDYLRAALEMVSEKNKH